MRFENYITEFSRERYGAGITFIDIDETVFRTFAKILVKKDGKVVRELDNQEFNSYTLQPDEKYDFHQFRDAEFFRKTSIPIPKTVNRIKKMLAQIPTHAADSRIVFLTAREDFDDKTSFLKAFEEVGIKMDKPNVYVERAGNIAKGGTIDAAKKKIMMKYIKTGKFRRVRLLDDFIPNLKALKEIEKELPKSVEDKIIKSHNLDMTQEHIPVISFYALHVQADGSLKQI